MREGRKNGRKKGVVWSNGDERGVDPFGVSWLSEKFKVTVCRRTTPMTECAPLYACAAYTNALSGLWFGRERAARSASIIYS